MELWQYVDNVVPLFHLILESEHLDVTVQKENFPGNSSFAIQLNGKFVEFYSMYHRIYRNVSLKI